MKLVLIPPGEFSMGSGESRDQLLKAFGARQYSDPSDQFPQHRVRITKAFYIGAYHVTIAQFRQFVRSTGYATEVENGLPHSEHGSSGGSIYGELPPDKQGDGSMRYTWKNPGFRQAEDHPVLEVSWDDAVAFCRWLSRKESKVYRLPTEGEWEFVCRAGTGTRYHNGNDPEELPEVANIADGTLREIRLNAEERVKQSGGLPVLDTLPESAIRAKDGYMYTSPVGAFKPNAWGVYDMHGNAAQWCADGYQRDYYRLSPRDDPSGPARRTDLRVARGASWASTAFDARSANRAGWWPFVANDRIGFRVVQELHRKDEKEKENAGGIGS